MKNTMFCTVHVAIELIANMPELPNTLLWFVASFYPKMVERASEVKCCSLNRQKFQLQPVEF